MDNTGITQSASDVLNQQIYDLKREVARLTHLEKDYLNEIDNLQTIITKNSKEWQHKVATLEEEKRAIEQAKTLAVEEIEATLNSKSEEIKTLNDQLEALSKNRLSVDDSSVVQGLNQKTQELELEISKLKEENAVMRECALNLEKDIHVYEETMNNLKDDYKILSENNQRKSEDLTESKRLVETLQDELAMIKIELDVLKNKPDGSSGQGNSLFAEVDEKRVELQTKVNRMKTHYDEMKQQISRLENQVFKMRIENGTLKENWEREVEERSNDRYDIEESYKIRINVLENLINEYKKELDSRPLLAVKALKEEELSLIEYRIEMKNKQIDTLLAKYDRTSLSNMLLTERNREVMKEATSWRLKFTQVQDDLNVKDDIISKLEEQIRNLEITAIEQSNVSIQSPNLTPCLSVVKREKNLENNIDLSRLHKRSASLVKNKFVGDDLEKNNNKENDICIGSEKKVQFASDVKDCAAKARNIRRTGKVTICEPTILKKREFKKKEF